MKTSPAPVVVPRCEVQSLRVAATGAHHPIPTLARFTLGRDEGVDLRLDDPSVSRLHALVERHPTHLHCFDAGSSVGTFVDGRVRAVTDVYPGGAPRFGCCDVLALSPAMDAAAHHLDRLLGANDQVHAALRASRDTRCLVVVGPPGTAHHAIAAAIRDAAGPAERSEFLAYTPNLPRGEDLDRLLTSLRGGWLLLDTTAREAHLTNETMERVLAPLAGVTFVLAVTDHDHIPLLLQRFHPQVITATPIAHRLRTQHAVEIDRVLAWRGLSQRTPDLHPDLVHALVAHPWPGAYAQFSDVVSFVGRRLAGQRYEAATADLFASAPSVNRWALELGLDRRLVGLRAR